MALGSSALPWVLAELQQIISGALIQSKPSEHWPRHSGLITPRPTTISLISSSTYLQRNSVGDLTVILKNMPTLWHQRPWDLCAAAFECQTPFLSPLLMAKLQGSPADALWNFRARSNSSESWIQSSRFTSDKLRPKQLYTALKQDSWWLRNMLPSLQFSRRCLFIYFWKHIKKELSICTLLFFRRFFNFRGIHS